MAITCSSLCLRYTGNGTARLKKKWHSVILMIVHRFPQQLNRHQLPGCWSRSSLFPMCMCTSYARSFWFIAICNAINSLPQAGDTSPRRRSLKSFWVKKTICLFLFSNIVPGISMGLTVMALFLNRYWNIASCHEQPKQRDLLCFKCVRF